MLQMCYTSLRPQVSGPKRVVYAGWRASAGWAWMALAWPAVPKDHDGDCLKSTGTIVTERRSAAALSGPGY